MKYTQEPSILQGMPSLLDINPFPYFQNKWPLSKTLPSLEGSLKSKDAEVFNLGKIFSSNIQDIPFEPRTQMQVTECEHKDRKTTLKISLQFSIKVKGRKARQQNVVIVIGKCLREICVVVAIQESTRNMLKEHQRYRSENRPHKLIDVNSNLKSY